MYASLRKGCLLFLLGLLLFGMFSGAGSAEEFQVGSGKKFTTTQTLDQGDSITYDFDTFTFTLGDDQEVKYSVQTVYTGKVQVLFCTGVTILGFDYIPAYSADEPTEAYSNTFSSADLYSTNDFFIAVVNTEEKLVDYNITIEITKDYTNQICIAVACGILLAIVAVIVVVVAIIFINSRRKKKAQQPKGPPCPDCNKPQAFDKEYDEFYCPACEDGERKYDDEYEKLYGRQRPAPQGGQGFRDSFYDDDWDDYDDDDDRDSRGKGREQPRREEGYGRGGRDDGYDARGRGSRYDDYAAQHGTAGRTKRASYEYDDYDDEDDYDDRYDRGRRGKERPRGRGSRYTDYDDDYEDDYDDEDEYDDYDDDNDDEDDYDDYDDDYDDRYSQRRGRGTSGRGSPGRGGGRRGGYDDEDYDDDDW